MLRYWNGKKIPPQVQRTRSADLLASVFPDVAVCQENVDGPIQVPDHPLIREVMKDIFYDALDLEGLQQLLRRIRSGQIKCIAVDTPVPSVFSHEILNSNPYAYLDDAPLEERRARAVEMRRTLPESVLKEVGALDPAAIAEVCADAWPDVRDADELADALQTLIALPEDFRTPDGRPSAEVWLPFFERLRQTNRATRAKVREQLHADAGEPHNASDIWFWVSAEKRNAFHLIYPEAEFEDQLPELPGEAPSRDDALKATTTGWLAHLGPVTASGLASFLRLPIAEIEKTLLRIEATGLILRGQFTTPARQNQYQPGPPAKAGVELAGVEWCERRLLARIHRLTLARCASKLSR